MSPYTQHLCANQLWKMHIKHNWDKGIHYPSSIHLKSFSRMPVREATKFGFSNTINTDICKENRPLMVQTEVKKGSYTTQIDLFLTPWQEYNYTYCYTYKATPANNKTFLKKAYRGLLSRLIYQWQINNVLLNHDKTSKLPKDMCLMRKQRCCLQSIRLAIKSWVTIFSIRAVQEHCADSTV